MQGKKELKITLFFPKVNFVQQNSYLTLLIAERKKENVDLTNKTKILTRLMLMIIYVKSILRDVSSINSNLSTICVNVVIINGNLGRVICNLNLFRKKAQLLF